MVLARILVVLVGVSINLYGHAQIHTDSVSTMQEQTKTVGVLIGHAGGMSGSLLVLNRLWYAEYPFQSFRLTNDWNDWNKMDKLGHMWSAYTISRLSAATWQWSGISTTKADLLGTASAIGYQTIIELADGFSSHWGFSCTDMAANLAGGGLYLGQQLAWQEQRLCLKVMAYKPYPYSSALAPRASELFGQTVLSQLINDYNIQTYWLCSNLKAWLPNRRLPGWLGFSIGYGSRLMVGRTQNQWINSQGERVDYSATKRYGRFFLAPDIDLTKIRTKRKWLRTTFWLLNTVRLPLPALEISGNGQLKLHALLLN